MAGQDPSRTPSPRRGSALESYVRELVRDAGWTAARSSQRRVQQSADGMRRIAGAALGARPGPEPGPRSRGG
jgi:hypothetical protein